MKIVKNVAASIRVRLLEHAKRHGDNYQRVLTRYAIERLLFRLSQTQEKERFILKGAMLFATWPEHTFRPTGDLDLLGEGNPTPGDIVERFAHICRVDVPDDGIRFDSAGLRADAVREEDIYQGVRLNLNAELARAIIPVQVDIGFGDYTYPPPGYDTFPNLLAGLPEATIRMYRPETVIAEKFEAMVRFGEANGRIKDFYDIWVTTRTFSFDLSNLVIAVDGTLRRRNTATPITLPVGLTDAFALIVEERALWTAFLRRTPPNIAPPTFHQVLIELREFFAPVLASIVRAENMSARWNPGHGSWQ